MYCYCGLGLILILIAIYMETNRNKEQLLYVLGFLVLLLVLSLMYKQPNEGYSNFAPVTYNMGNSSGVGGLGCGSGGAAEQTNVTTSATGDGGAAFVRIQFFIRKP